MIDEDLLNTFLTNYLMLSKTNNVVSRNKYTNGMFSRTNINVFIAFNQHYNNKLNNCIYKLSINDDDDDYAMI